MSAQRPIGVFDSGVGGLTVVHRLREALPEQDILYLGDTARVPYGTKSPRTVERYAGACHRFLVDRQVKLVVIACNTASATALPSLQQASAVPVIGAVQPGAQAAVDASKSRHIGVIGTLATINSQAYERAIEILDHTAVVTARACPLFVPLAEEGWTDGDVPRAIAERYLGSLFEVDPQIDTLVLGCTHYPLLEATIESTACALAGRPISVVDSARTMAKAACEALADRSPGPDPGHRGTLRCFVTDASRLEDLAPRFLGEPISSFELVDL